MSMGRRTRSISTSGLKVFPRTATHNGNLIDKRCPVWEARALERRNRRQRLLPLPRIRSPFAMMWRGTVHAESTTLLPCPPGNVARMASGTSCMSEPLFAVRGHTKLAVQNSAVQNSVFHTSMAWLACCWPTLGSCPQPSPLASPLGHCANWSGQKLNHTAGNLTFTFARMGRLSPARPPGEQTPPCRVSCGQHLPSWPERLPCRGDATFVSFTPIRRPNTGSSPSCWMVQPSTCIAASPLAAQTCNFAVDATN